MRTTLPTSTALLSDKKPSLSVDASLLLRAELNDSRTGIVFVLSNTLTTITSIDLSNTRLFIRINPKNKDGEPQCNMTYWQHEFSHTPVSIHAAPYLITQHLNSFMKEKHKPFECYFYEQDDESTMATQFYAVSFAKKKATAVAAAGKHAMINHFLSASIKGELSNIAFHLARQVEPPTNDTDNNKHIFITPEGSCDFDALQAMKALEHRACACDLDQSLFFPALSLALGRNVLNTTAIDIATDPANTASVLITSRIRSLDKADIAAELREKDPSQLGSGASIFKEIHERIGDKLYTSDPAVGLPIYCTTKNCHFISRTFKLNALTQLLINGPEFRAFLKVSPEHTLHLFLLEDQSDELNPDLLATCNAALRENGINVALHTLRIYNDHTITKGFEHLETLHSMNQTKATAIPPVVVEEEKAGPVRVRTLSTISELSGSGILPDAEALSERATPGSPDRASVLSSLSMLKAKREEAKAPAPRAAAATPSPPPTLSLVCNTAKAHSKAPAAAPPPPRLRNTPG